MSEWKFKRDTSFRKQFFVPDSFAHPAKMDAQLLIKIVEEYTQVGETILDPMAGSGTMMLACTLGRNCVLVELEDKFCKMMRDNWEEVKMRPQLGYLMGDCQIIQGDARQLGGLVDKIVTSPPYAEAMHGDSQEGLRRTRERLEAGKFKSVRPDCFYSEGNVGTVAGGETGYGESDNISKLPYGQIDKIVTSPPYEEAMGVKHHSPRADKLAQEKSNPVTYTDRVDSIITSPPFSEQKTGGEQGAGKYSGTDLSQGINRVKDDYSPPENKDNIGNLKSDTYLQAMLQVYQQCHKVLKPAGLMILVTKNFIRNKQVIRLDEDTIKLCEQAGFNYLERHNRELPSQSFWRVIYHKKHPEVEQILSEDILVFKK